MDKHEKNIRAFFAFMILVVAFSILTVFVRYHDKIIQAGKFPLFVALSAAGLGLLTILLFLGGKTHVSKKMKHTKKKKSSRK